MPPRLLSTTDTSLLLVYTSCHATNRVEDTCTVLDEVLQVAAKQAELSAEMPVNKILFAMKGTDDVAMICDKKNVAEIKKVMPKYTVFTIVSNSKFGAMVDGEKISRGDFFKKLRED